MLLTPVVSGTGIEPVLYVVKLELLVGDPETDVPLRLEERGGMVTIAVPVILTTWVTVKLLLIVVVMDVVTSTVSVILKSKVAVAFGKGLDVVSGKPLSGAEEKVGNPV